MGDAVATMDRCSVAIIFEPKRFYLVAGGLSGERSERPTSVASRVEAKPNRRRRVLLGAVLILITKGSKDGKISYILRVPRLRGSEMYVLEA